MPPKTPAGHVVVRYLAVQIEQLRVQEPLVRVDAHDSIHTMRVATRRVRSSLRTFRPLFDPTVIEPLGVELAWLAGELGVARDAEVVRDRLLTSIPIDLLDSAAARRIVSALDEETALARRTAFSRTLEALDSERYQQLVVGLDALVSHPPLTPRAERPAAAELPRHVRRTYGGVRRRLRAARQLPVGAEQDHRLHSARKAAKQARDAADAASPVFGKPARTFARAMERLQDELGEHNDSVMLRERLTVMARGDITPDAGFTYGRLHAQEEELAAHSARRIQRAWKAASDPPLRTWLD